tara:strand:- start:912 stop:1208 length:297 start_codon:yes stop_codon:yes gene_type:complete
MVDIGTKENSELKKAVDPENDLKNMIVEYVGQELSPEDNLVTLEMVIDVVAKEFPEFVLALAEENWIRGYQQGLDDVDTGMNMTEENEKRKNCKLCEK